MVDLTMEFIVSMGSKNGEASVIIDADSESIDANAILECFKEARRRGLWRVGLYVVTRRLSAGDVLGMLRPVLKGDYLMSVTVWVLHDMDEVRRVLGVDVYG